VSTEFNVQEVEIVMITVQNSTFIRNEFGTSKYRIRCGINADFGVKRRGIRESKFGVDCMEFDEERSNSVQNSTNRILYDIQRIQWLVMYLDLTTSRQ
jgi:hypothetical protein